MNSLDSLDSWDQTPFFFFFFFVQAATSCVYCQYSSVLYRIVSVFSLMPLEGLTSQASALAVVLGSIDSLRFSASFQDIENIEIPCICTFRNILRRFEYLCPKRFIRWWTSPHSYLEITDSFEDAPFATKPKETITIPMNLCSTIKSTSWLSSNLGREDKEEAHRVWWNIDVRHHSGRYLFCFDISTIYCFAGWIVCCRIPPYSKDKGTWWIQNQRGQGWHCGHCAIWLLSSEAKLAACLLKSLATSRWWRFGP